MKVVIFSMSEVNWEPYLNREISISCANRTEINQLVELAKSSGVQIYHGVWLFSPGYEYAEFCAPEARAPEAHGVEDLLGAAYTRPGESYFARNGFTKRMIQFREFISSGECTADAQFDEFSFFELIGG